MAERQEPSVEMRDVQPRMMWVFLLAYVGFVAVSSVGLHLFFRPDQPWAFHRLAKPEPVQQVSPAADHAAFVAAKTAALSSRSARDTGRDRIPIEEAMRLVSEGYRATVETPGDGCQGAACPGATPTARTIR